MKRAQAKLKQKEEASAGGGGSAEEKLAATADLQASDVWESFAVYRADGPIRGFDFVPNHGVRKVLCRLSVMLASNAVEFVDLKKVCSSTSINSRQFQQQLTEHDLAPQPVLNSA